ncbi:MAG: 4Fe-4S dicluster domain-containing protein [Syntrophobacteraceae bacterium]|jgi:ech hydrogenase subunit F
MPVMLPTVLKNLFGGPATRLYPVTVREPFDNARGQITFNDDKCTLCGACALRCPADAISIDKEKKTLNFHPARCIVCEVCVLGCPSDAIDLGFKWRTPFYKKPLEVHEARGKKPRTPT